MLLLLLVCIRGERERIVGRAKELLLHRGQVIGETEEWWSVWLLLLKLTGLLLVLLTGSDHGTTLQDGKRLVDTHVVVVHEARTANDMR